MGGDVEKAQITLGHGVEGPRGLVIRSPGKFVLKVKTQRIVGKHRANTLHAQITRLGGELIKADLAVTGDSGAFRVTELHVKAIVDGQVYGADAQVIRADNQPVRQEERCGGFGRYPT